MLAIEESWYLPAQTMVRRRVNSLACHTCLCTYVWLRYLWHRYRSRLQGMVYGMAGEPLAEGRSQLPHECSVSCVWTAGTLIVWVGTRHGRYRPVDVQQLEWLVRVVCEVGD